MPPISTGNFPKLLWPGIRKVFGTTYNEYSPQYPMIFETNTSKKKYEEDVSLSPLGLASVKNEGSGITYDTTKQGFVKRYTHVTYANGFIITREAYEDNQYQREMVISSKSLARSMRLTKDIIGANVLNRAFNSDYTGGDGLELCSTAHLNEWGGTYQNELTTAADLSEASLEQALIDIGNMKDGRGNNVAIKPVRLIIPVDLEFEAVRILQSTLQNDTANNAINAIRASGKLSGGYTVNNFLTDTDAWFIKTDCPNGMNYFERWPDKFSMDNDFDTENGKYKAVGR